MANASTLEVFQVSTVQTIISTTEDHYEVTELPSWGVALIALSSLLALCIIIVAYCIIRRRLCTSPSPQTVVETPDGELNMGREATLPRRRPSASPSIHLSQRETDLHY